MSVLRSMNLPTNLRMTAKALLRPLSQELLLLFVAVVATTAPTSAHSAATGATATDITTATPPLLLLLSPRPLPGFFSLGFRDWIMKCTEKGLHDLVFRATFCASLGWDLEEKPQFFEAVCCPMPLASQALSTPRSTCGAGAASRAIGCVPWVRACTAACVPLAPEFFGFLWNAISQAGY